MCCRRHSLNRRYYIKTKKKEYYNIYTTKVNYLHRIEYAILNYLNEDSFIDELNNSFLNIHDKDIVAILGNQRKFRAYIINNHLIFLKLMNELIMRRVLNV